MGTVGRIAAGVASDLLERCADVHLKEGRPLVLAPREMPWSLIHLRNLTTLAEAVARIAPPIPAWYSQPQNLGEMVDFLVVRLFDSLGDDLGPLNVGRVASHDSLSTLAADSLSESGGVDAVDRNTQSRATVIVAGAHMEVATIAHWSLDRRRNGLRIRCERCGWIGHGDLESCAAT